MNDLRIQPKAETTERSLASLQDEVSGLRTEVSVLRDVQKGLSGKLGGRLADVNEQLVIAALRADTVAEQAVSDMHELAVSGQHDALTGTPNRALMVDRLEKAIALARRLSTRLAVLFLDLDRFKTINDTMGHAAGDEVLKLAARRMEAVVRDADTVSRHSGDEFVVLLSGVSRASDAALIATKLLAALSAACEVGGVAVSLSASIGIAVFPEDGEDAVTLVNRADAAMYRSKRQASGGFAFHREHLASDLGPEPGIGPAPGRPETRGVSDPARERYLEHLREANEKLVIAAVTAQEVEAQVDATHRRQITFLAKVAHELRNPLTPILQAADLMHRPRTDEPRLARLQGIIKRQVHHMSRLIDDLLDGSRIDTGKFRLERSAIDLMDIIATAIETCRPAMDLRQQHFTTKSSAASIHVYADAVRLTQIVSNLLDNASKYTLQGGAISLSVDAIDHAIRIVVSDNGIGITKEALPKIFDLFVQDAHAVEVHSGGLGIGLAVVRELVEAHGGTVTATSAGRDLGSRFVVTLPIAGHAPVAS